MKRFFIAILILVSCGTFAFAAGPSKNGRLADGRAFRTDAQGNQLVDYIAELELSVDALNRRVQGLEYELQQKQAELQRVAAGGTSTQQVNERDLIGLEKPAQENPIQEKSAQCPSCPQTVCPEVDCSLLLQQTSQANAAKEKNHQQLVNQVQGDLEIEKRMHALETSQLKARLESLEADLAAQKSELSTKAGLLLTKDKEIERIKLESARQMLQADEARAEFSSTKMRALDSVRGSLLTEFNQVRGLLSSRGNLIEQYKKSKPTVSFRPNPALSSEGESLDDLKQRIAEADTVGRLNQVRRPLNQIRAKLNEDLALIKRISR